MDKKMLLRKMILYFFGLLIMTFGVAISVKSDLGVTPITSIPYTMTVVTGMDLGITSMLFSIFFVLLQVILLRKEYKFINLLQIPIGVMFGLLVTACGKLMILFADPSNFIIKIIVMLIGTVFVALGVFLYVSAEIVPLAPEGFLVVVSKLTRIKFGTVKVVFDVIMVSVSLVTCLIVIHSFGSVGIGTVVAAFLVGTEVKLCTKLWGDRIDSFIG